MASKLDGNDDDNGNKNINCNCIDKTELRLPDTPFSKGS
jgi:hypothetical protein